MTARIHDDRACFLGEGVFHHPERDQLFWFDILAGRLLSRDGDAQLEWNFGECASAAGWIDRDTLLIATETGLRRFDIATGDHAPIIAIEADDPATRSNDGRADPMGGFWIGTMGKRAEPGAGAFYRFHRGELRKLAGGISIPNSTCFSPDGRIAYLSDTAAQLVWSWPLDENGWPVGERQVFHDFREEGLYPDGAVTDAEGGVWIAQWGAGRVARYHPDGRFDRAVAVGGAHSSCPCFGGPELSTLYVTTAQEGIAAPGPAEGVLYAAEGAALGLPAPQILL